MATQTPIEAPAASSKSTKLKQHEASSSDSLSLSSKYLPPVRLPEPWKTTYEIRVVSETADNLPILNLALSETQVQGATLPPEQLHNDSLTFSDLTAEQGEAAFVPAVGDNSAWARFHQTPISHLSWDDSSSSSSNSVTVTVGQIWNLVYALVTLYPEIESFRLDLGPGSSGNDNDKTNTVASTSVPEKLSEALQATGLANPRPAPSRPEHKQPQSQSVQVWITRSAFWQGAGSPFGTRPVWVAHPDLYSHLTHLTTTTTNNGTSAVSLTSQFPPFPQEDTITFSLAGRPVHAQHPIRPPKPSRGAVIYSRYIPHLDEFFSMVHLDYHNPEHLRLFHEWQNDPRVSQGWNETGTLEQHRDYLRRIDEDPHQMAILAKFNDVFFAYFEIYWAKEDHMGVYISPAPQDWDRGRHSLVGNVRYRGPHRASAWWSSLVHYLFLDEPRTMTVVGEPKYTNANVLGYDAQNGFHVHKLADLPHKRSAIVRCERTRFFQCVGFGLPGGNVRIAEGKGAASGQKQSANKATTAAAKAKL
ncbi:Hydroxyornithine transacylase SID3 [Exophiala dermatitidis]